MAFVEAATLVLRHTLGATKQEALVADARLHAAFVALCCSIWVFTGSWAGIPTELIMAVLWALGWSCSISDKITTCYQHRMRVNLEK